MGVAAVRTFLLLMFVFATLSAFGLFLGGLLIFGAYWVLIRPFRRNR